jgi:hypothetical protein
VDAGIVRAYPQVRRAPTRNCDGLAALSEGKGKGDGGGGPELFVGVAGASSYAGNEGI